MLTGHLDAHLADRLILSLSLSMTAPNCPFSDWARTGASAAGSGSSVTASARDLTDRAGLAHQGHHFSARAVAIAEYAELHIPRR